MPCIEVAPIGISTTSIKKISINIDIHSSHGEPVSYQKDDDGDIEYFQESQLNDLTDDKGYFHGSESNKMSNVKLDQILKQQLTKNDSIDSFKSARGSLG